VWAKRNLSPTTENCQAAARAATAAEAGGQDAIEAARQSAVSRSGPGWESPPDQWVRSYAEWFDWARLNLGSDGEGNHRAAAAAVGALTVGADLSAAMSAAREAAVGPDSSVAGPRGLPPPPALVESAVDHAPVVPAYVPNPPAAPIVSYSPDGRHWWDGREWRPIAAGAQGSVYAGFGRRLVALILDAILLNIALAILYTPLDAALFAGVTPTSDQYPGQVGIHLLLSTLVNFLYSAGLMSSAAQATLGQMALGIKTVDRAGNRLSFLRAAARHLATWITAFTFGIGYLVMAWSGRRQTLHDMIAGTLVVRRDTPAGVVPGEVAAGGGGIAIAIGAIGLLLLTSLMVVVVLLTMGGQIKNVFSNVTEALNT